MEAIASCGNIRHFICRTSSWSILEIHSYFSHSNLSLNDATSRGDYVAEHTCFSADFNIFRVQELEEYYNSFIECVTIFFKFYVLQMVSLVAKKAVATIHAG